MKPLTSPQDPIFVTNDDLEHQIEQLKNTGEALSGFFGPSSLTWRVGRESALFLGAGRALLLQLAHPWIAAAIGEHSSVLVNRIGRFHRTFAITFTMTFGTRDQAVGAARRLHRRHAAIHGVLPQKIGCFPAGSAYRANEIAALRWVLASLIDTSVIIHDLVLPPLTVNERECFYAESRVTAALFGIPHSSIPEHWSDFVAYKEAMVSSDLLIVSEAARAIAKQIITPQGAGIRSPRWYWDLTAHLLPPSLREAFGLDYGKDEVRRAQRVLAWLARVYPLMPKSLRFVGPYQEAVGRLAGRAVPDWATQWLNLMWIGRRQLG
jgi:uncharacterized protein (DUF2236 family)